MKTYRKNYIGKGIQHPKMDIVKITLKVEDVLKYQHEFQGENYVTFEVAKLQQADKFGRTHTAYVTTREEVPETADEPAPKPRRRRKPQNATN